MLDARMDLAETRALESLLAFWTDSGVDAAYAEAPVDRLAEGALKLQPPARQHSATRTAAQPVRARPASGVSTAVAQARSLAFAAQDLAELEAAIAGFDGCALKFAGFARTVFARGNPDGPVMVIGEGPGAEEDAQGLPFVGRAGRLLDKMLIAAGLSERVFITNTVFWRPPGNRTPRPKSRRSARHFWNAPSSSLSRGSCYWPAPPRPRRC